MSDEHEFTRLDQFLKLTGIVDSGGQAKILIQSGEVLVNGEVETRRRRKLIHSDVVQIEGTDYAVKAGVPILLGRDWDRF